jgi:hypothetical protein
MANTDPMSRRFTNPLAQLERHLIDDYVLALGYDPHALRLTEVEPRAHYVRELHDGRG